MRSSPMDGYASRFQKRQLSEMLVHKFLTEYGYDHGPVIARAIVKDILSTVERCYSDHVPPQTVVWLAVRKERGKKRKGLDVNDLVPVQLKMVNEEEMALLTDKSLRRIQEARRAFNRTRFARWCFDAFEQGGVLTLLDLCLLSGLSETVVHEHIHAYEAETGKIVPTRGTVHDIGGSVTHRAEVVRRWLRHESPTDIARALNHSQDAVDRYIADFQKVRLLVQKFSADDLPVLAGLSVSVVKQYLALLEKYEPDLQWFEQSAEENTGS